MKKLHNFSLFSNSGIGEYGTNNINISFNDENYIVETVVANELLPERAEIFRNNYPNTNMICGSITDPDTNNLLAHNFNKTKPTTATFSPPCQGSSGLNAFKDNPYDFRNQLVKSVFQLFDKVKDSNTLEIGYIENVVQYYTEDIPAKMVYLDRAKSELYNEFIVTKDNKYLNYQYILFTDNPSLHKKQDYSNSLEQYELLSSEEFKNMGKKYALCFNENSCKKSRSAMIKELKKINKEDVLLTPMRLIDYINESMELYGFKTDFKVVRGEEYGGCQVRQRGFLLFFKEGITIKFPKELYQKSTSKDYNGKTMLDAFQVMGLIKILDDKIDEKQEGECNSEKHNLMLKHPYKKVGGKIYIDTSITEEEGQDELNEWVKKGYPNDDLPNLHFRKELKERYKIWIENTKEGQSAYKNEKRIHRPYKLIEVSKKNGKYQIKNNQTKVVEKDTKKWFSENNVIDYIDFVTKEMKTREGDKEWGKNGRKWQIKDIEDRKEIEKTAIKHAKDLLLDNEKETYYIFMPIKGFEGATYKRATLEGVSSALTTKNQIGNSNTVHPIFDRPWTPKEYMALFGVGYVFEDGEYRLASEYVPPKNIEKITTFQNLIFEIHGEAIISTVAEQIMKSMVLQWLSQREK